MLATGKAPRAAAATLATISAVGLGAHPFWTEVDGELKRKELGDFVGGVSRFGALLIVAADTEGKPSLRWRSERAAEAARERGADLAETARERGADLYETAREKAPHSLTTRRSVDFHFEPIRLTHCSELPPNTRGGRSDTSAASSGHRKRRSRAHGRVVIARHRAGNRLRSGQHDWAVTPTRTSSGGLRAEPTSSIPASS